MPRRSSRAALAADPDVLPVPVGDQIKLVPRPDSGSVLSLGPRKRVRPHRSMPEDEEQPAPNRLWYGDNLEILGHHIDRESVDLVYLDPPFNSSRAYNVLFAEPSGQVSPAQIHVFTDTWRWTTDTEAALGDIKASAPLPVQDALVTLCQLLKKNDVSAYLVMMTPRLLEMYRVLKSTGTVYLHCDPTVSHYLRLILDAIFGPDRFLNEITWKRSSAHSDTKQGMRRCGRIRDVLLVYTKSDDYTWNPVYTPYDPEYIQSEYRHVAPDGRHYKETDLTAAKPGGDTSYEWRVKRQVGIGARWEADFDDEYHDGEPGIEYRGVRPYRGRYWAYGKETLQQFAREVCLIHRETGMPRLMQFADEMPGVPLQDLWEDIAPVLGNESLGFATQKPMKLLERIIATSSNPGDVTLDPFCGCGTAVVAAEKLGRRWIGIDITSLAIGIMEYRLGELFESRPRYDIKGLPKDLRGAQDLIEDRGPHQFQWWVVSLLGAVPHDGRQKKGADQGIDGIILFEDPPAPKSKLCIVQVKSGHVGPRDVRDLLGTVTTRPGAEIGVLVTLEPPTLAMRKAAAEAGVYWSDRWGRHFPRIQILTTEEILAGRMPDLPPSAQQPRRRPKFRAEHAAQQPLPDWP